MDQSVLYCFLVIWKSSIRSTERSEKQDAPSVKVSKEVFTCRGCQFSSIIDTNSGGRLAPTNVPLLELQLWSCCLVPELTYFCVEDRDRCVSALLRCGIQVSVDWKPDADLIPPNAPMLSRMNQSDFGTDKIMFSIWIMSRMESLTNHRNRTKIDYLIGDQSDEHA